MSAEPTEVTIARLREQLLVAQARINELEARLERPDPRVEQERQLAIEAQSLADRHLEAAQNAKARARYLDAVRNELSRVASRLLELDAQRRAMQRSRAWRWTAPIRSIERWFSGGK